MCGRYVLTDLGAFLARAAWVRAIAAEQAQQLFPQPRYNAAPIQTLPVVRPDRNDPRQGVVEPMRWGLVPSWATDPSVGNRMINARAETLAEKNSFRKALEIRRCLVPADAFYEWRKPHKPREPKQPHLIRLQEDRPMAFAGLWERWRSRDRDEPPLLTFTIITCAANPLVAELHDRMPVILHEADYRKWLDPALPAEEATDLLRPYPADEMTLYPVGRRVGNVRNDDAELLARVNPAPSQPEQPELF